MMPAISIMLDRMIITINEVLMNKIVSMAMISVTREG